ncbi:MAG: hypothetical protein QXI19_02695 [Candidatus Caldarchaeum sp.]
MKHTLKDAVVTIVDRLLDGEKLLSVKLFGDNDEGTEWTLEVQIYNPQTDWTRDEKFYFHNIIDTESFRYHVVAAARQIMQLREAAGRRDDNTDAIENLIIEHAYQHVYLDSLYMRLRNAVLDAVVRESQGGE